MSQLRLAVMNRKGGVGKTSVASGIASIAAAQRKHVLVIDFDPQCNLTRRLLPDYDLDNRVLMEIMLDGKPIQPLETRYSHLDIVPSGTSLRRLDRELDPETDRFDLLAGPINRWCQDWDIIIIDGPPMEESMQAAAIGAAPWIIAPARADEDSIDGLEDLAGLMLTQRQEQDPPWAELLGVVAFAWKRTATRRNAEATGRIATMLAAFGREVLFRTVVWEGSTSAEDMRSRLLLPSDIPADWTGPERALARSYEELYEEIIARHEGVTAQ